MKSKSKRSQWLLNILMVIIVIAFITPFILLITASFSEEMTVLKSGYSFIPKKISLNAYRYLWQKNSEIIRAYGISIFVTIIGSVVGLSLTTMLAYPLSRKDFPFRNVLSFLVFFVIIFNGGMVPTYLTYTSVISVKNTIWAQILPYLLVNGFNVLLMRAFFSSNIPKSILESARLDGAGEFRIFTSIVLPISKPIIATIGILVSTKYWNNWLNQMLFISDPDLFTIQNYLRRIMTDIQFIQSIGVASNAGIASFPSETIRMAIAVVGIVPMLVAYPFFQKYFKKGIVLGAVKE